MQRQQKCDSQLVKSISNATSEVDKYIVMLKNDFGYTLTISDLAKILNISVKTIRRRIAESMNIPNYIRTGSGEKADYLFPVVDVAKFLFETHKTM